MAGNGEQALKVLIEECEDAAASVEKFDNEAQKAVPMGPCGAHWPLIKSLSAHGNGIRVLLRCRAQDYRTEAEHMDARNLRVGSRSGDGGGERQRPAVKILGARVPLVVFWLLAIIVAALAGAGVLKPVVLFFFSGK
jgi:hypothetical protein